MLSARAYPTPSSTARAIPPGHADGVKPKKRRSLPADYCSGVRSPDRYGKNQTDRYAHPPAARRQSVSGRSSARVSLRRPVQTRGAQHHATLNASVPGSAWQKPCTAPSGYSESRRRWQQTPDVPRSIRPSGIDHSTPPRQPHCRRRPPPHRYRWHSLMRWLPLAATFR